MKKFIDGISLFVLILFVYSCGTEKKTTETEVNLVKTVKVNVEEFSETINAAAILFGEQEILLSFKTGGIIDRITVKPGDYVKKGQVLAYLKLSEINSLKDQAENVYKKSERDLERVQNLFDDKAATLEQLQDVKTAFEVAKSNLSIAQFNLTHSSITAPESGIILRKFAEESEMIAPGMPVLQMLNSAKGWVLKTGIADKDVVRLKKGDKASAVFDAYPDKVFNAEVKEISAAPDQQTGTYSVSLDINSEKVSFVSGLAAKIKIFSSANNRYQTIPVECLIEPEGNSAFVYTIGKDNRVEKHPVTIASVKGDKVIIQSGLEEIKEIIKEGAAFLSEYDLVQIIN